MQMPENYAEILRKLSDFNIGETPVSCEKLEAQKEFKAECDRFTSIAKEYLPVCKKLYSDSIPQIARKDYATGGELLTRGYYCPSPIRDIVIGNCNRGKLLKRVTSHSKPAYEYCFDENDRLILVNYLYSDCAEILEYNGDTVTGITFSNDEEHEVTRIIECQYDENNRITSFIVARSSFNDCNINEIEKETYAYNEKGLDIAELFNYFEYEGTGTLNYNRFKFRHDDEGYLKEYQDETSIFENAVYQVYVKRKV